LKNKESQKEPLITAVNKDSEADAAKMEREFATYSYRRLLLIVSICGLLAGCVIIALLGLTVGSVGIPFKTVWQVLISHLPFVHA
jgi:hypothetical protein